MPVLVASVEVEADSTNLDDAWIWSGHGCTFEIQHDVGIGVHDEV